MPSKRLIPASREDDVLHILWVMLSELESKCDRRPGEPGYDPYQRQLVTSAYNILNDIGYTKHRPRWEEARAAEEARKAVNYYMVKRKETRPVVKDHLGNL